MSRLAFLIGLYIASGIVVAQPTTESQDFQYYQRSEPQWYYEASVTPGISYLVFDHARNNAFYSRTGAYVDANFNFHFPDLKLPVIFGAGVSASGFWDNDNFEGVDSVYSNVNLISLEGRVSLPLYFFNEADGGPFLMPRIGFGGLFDNYVVQTPFTGNNYHNGGAVEVRPSIEFGYRYDQFAIGVEVSYMAAWGSFGDFGSAAQECRGGILISYRW